MEKTQKSLFEEIADDGPCPYYPDTRIPPRARTTDPEPSHTAARQVVNSGQLSEQQRLVLNIVKLHPDRDCRQLSELSGVDYYVFARRMPELVKAGSVICSGTHSNPETGRTMSTYRADNDRAKPVAASDVPT